MIIPIITDAFVSARNNCKYVLKETKSLFVDRMRHYIASKFGSCDYSQLCNKVLNNSKFSIPPLFTQFEVLTSADKEEHFACKFSSNSTLNSSGVSLIDFPLNTKTMV